MNTAKKLFGLFTIAALLLSLSACKKQKSATTGWNYNDAKNGGFEVKKKPPLTVYQGGFSMEEYVREGVEMCQE